VPVERGQLDAHPAGLRLLDGGQGFVAQPRGLVVLALDESDLGESDLVEGRAAQAVVVTQFDGLTQPGNCFLGVPW